MTKSSALQIVLLGTGTPNAEPERSGSALAVIVHDVPYLVDCGPGIVRRANAAFQRGLQALALPALTTAFVTHLHSDHTAGYPDLILTPWVLGRDQPLQVFGPVGIKAMTHHILSPYQADIQERLEGLEPANTNGCQVDVHEIEPGRVYDDENVCVDAFSSNHGSWPVLGFRFTTPDGIIVVSGDTAPYEASLKIILVAIF
jgi:ribonuclease BN (tRNA processing enzyme)